MWIEIPNTAENFPYKIVSILGHFGCQRSIETVDTKFEDIITQENCIIVTNVKRAKASVNEMGTFAIMDDSARNVIMLYIDLFPTERKNGRLLNKLRGDYAPLNQVFGKNTMHQYGKKIAELLNLNDPERYTSHCYRRSAASQLAE